MIVGSLLVAVLLSGAPLSDGVAPPQAGVAQAGRYLDLVLRPTRSGCRLLLSDAQSDAPVLGVHPRVRGFGGAAATEVIAVEGSEDGHYLFECPREGEPLVVEVPRAAEPDVFAVVMPKLTAVATPELPRPRPQLPLLAIAAAVGILALLTRRAAKVLIAISVLAATGHAAAHGVDEAAVPVPAGSEIHLAQEIQFALELRTAPVVVAAFAPAGGAPLGASRQYPAVARSAIVERNSKKLVFVRLGPERFVGREVTLGWSNGDQVAVTSGLNPGELAVISGAAFLRNGGATGP